MARISSYTFSSLLVFFTLVAISSAQLSSTFYSSSCPNALSTIKSAVNAAINKEKRMAASLLRLHFHDCFHCLQGCDGSVLLDDNSTFTGEKTAGPNLNSIRGFDVIDNIKTQVESVCNQTVSCADILAVAARDSVVALGGPSYQVQLGRRDARTASQAAANNSIPAPTFNFSRLVSNFASQGLTMQDLVLLSGAHTLGFARCTTFRDRLYNESCTLDTSLASSLKSICPLQSGNGDNNLSPLDGTPAKFDTVYYDRLLQRKGLLHSDQQLYKGDGSGSDGFVKFYSKHTGAFWEDFGGAMLRMGALRPLTGSNGEIRMDCRKVN
ncbi:peroxidase P7-like protein [Carex littledalei]|uniref:Peroxidase n=1 Tax=Carex littledalei TaxID=544730 RepID=A0A833R4M2_9POAL|nr:peroxidase P7-like protein [Carex littledalei]